MAKIGGAVTQVLGRAAREVLGEVTNRVTSEVRNQARAEVRTRLGVPDGVRTSAAIKGEAARMIRQGTVDKLSALSARLGASRGDHPAQPGGPSSLDLGAAYQAVRAGLGSEVARHVLTQVVPARLEQVAPRLAGGSPAPAADPKIDPQAQASQADGATVSATLSEPFADPDLPHAQPQPSPKDGAAAS